MRQHVLEDAYSVAIPANGNGGGNGGSPETLDLVFLLFSDVLLSKVYHGSLNLTDGRFTVDTSTLIDTIDWSGFLPNGPGNPLLFYPLPNGGLNVGINSCCCCIQKNTSDNYGLDTQSAIMVYDGVSKQVAGMVSSAPGRRFAQPIPDADLWWYIEYELPFGKAWLKTVPLDLSEAPTTVQGLGFSEETTQGCWGFWLSPTKAYAGDSRGALNPVTDIWVFNRDGSGSAMKRAFTPPPLSDFFTNNDFPSGRPHNAFSWRMYSNAGFITDEGYATTLLELTDVEETRNWAEDFMNRLCVAVEMPSDPNKVLISSGIAPDGGSIVIADKESGIEQTFVEVGGVSEVQAAWVKV